MRAGIKLIHGVGTNDADYKVTWHEGGKECRCSFYRVWSGMLERCYSKKSLERRPSYAGCSVAEEWHLFSNFKKWMEAQDWHGKELDKDILFKGNKVYSPERCVFIDGLTNTFTLDNAARRGDMPIGACYDKSKGAIFASCSNPFTDKYEKLGRFESSEAAHKAWKKRKHELACQLADLQTDERVAEALRLRYA